MLLIFLLGLVSVGLSFLFVWLSKLLIDVATGDSLKYDFWFVVIWYLSLIFGRILLTTWNRWFSTTTSAKITKTLRARLYDETNVRYIKDSKLGVFIYRLAVAAMVMIGAVVSLDFAWSFADITMALLTLCNLVAIVLLSRQAVFLLQDYRQQKKEGKNPVFSKDKMPEIADQLEAW